MEWAPLSAACRREPYRSNPEASGENSLPACPLCATQATRTHPSTSPGLGKDNNVLRYLERRQPRVLSLGQASRWSRAYRNLAERQLSCPPSDKPEYSQKNSWAH